MTMIPQRQNEDQSVAKQIAKEQAKRLAKKQGKKLLKAFWKKAGKAAVSAIAKALLAILKAILVLLGGVSVPVLITIIAFLVVIVAFMVLSNFHVADNGAHLNSLDKGLYEYMLEKSKSTYEEKVEIVPPSKPYFVEKALGKGYQIVDKGLTREDTSPYITPVQTLTAVLQVYATIRDSTTFEQKTLIKELVEELQPKFEFKRFTNYKVSGSKIYVSRVDKISKVTYWNAILTKKYERDISDNAATFIVTSSEHTIDYTILNDFLNFEGFSDKDKVLTETFFEMASGHGMGYTKWLAENGLINPSEYKNVYGYGGGGGFLPDVGVPPQYYELYKKAEAIYHVPWYYIAAIHFVETRFSTNLHTSSAGAIGHTQWMKCTWIGWNYPGCAGTNGNINIPINILVNLGQIDIYGGYGVDGNGDGKADPMTIEDSLLSTASYLSKNGINSNAEQAIYAYNHSSKYIADVLAAANRFKDEGVYSPPAGSLPPMTSGYFMRPTTGAITSPFGPRSGKNHYGVDIGKGGRPGDVPIVAVADGKVVKSYLSSSYGNCVILEHTIEGRKYQTLYAHMTYRAVAAGQTVGKGQVLGNMGNTGRSEGAHLHFEIHSPSWNSSKSHAINPQLIIPF